MAQQIGAMLMGSANLNTRKKELPSHPQSLREQSPQQNRRQSASHSIDESMHRRKPQPTSVTYLPTQPPPGPPTAVGLLWLSLRLSVHKTIKKKRHERARGPAQGAPN